MPPSSPSMHYQTMSVYKSTGLWYILRDSQGAFQTARVKGKLRINKSISSSNPIAVGDQVLVDAVEKNDQTELVIADIVERDNYIVRTSPQNAHQKHIIAANIDLCALIVCVNNPRTSTGFIDRFLLTAEAYHIPSVIIINKSDAIIDETDKLECESIVELYTRIGYPVFKVSAITGSGMPELEQFLEGKRTLMSGHSGVGKSSLLNVLLGTSLQKTTALSDYTGKGQHTTTFAEMFDKNVDTQIIDTPGIKEFGISNISREELWQYFIEFSPYQSNCKFNNCLHINEPHCGIKQAVKEGYIDANRYINYQIILESISILNY